MKNLQDLNKQILLAKKAFEYGPIQIESHVSIGVEKYRRHLWIRN
jgi:hypothetical protein